MKVFKVLIGFILVLAFVILTVYFFEFEMVQSFLSLLYKEPYWFFIMLIIYGAAFFLRAYAWQIYLQKEVSFSTCLNILWYSLFVNHLMPFKVGDLLRVFLISQTKKVSWDEGLHSVIVMRTLDLVILLCISITGAIVVFDTLKFNRLVLFVSIIVVLLVIGLLFLKRKFSSFYQKHIRWLTSVFHSKWGMAIVFFVGVSWVFEAVVIYIISKYLMISVSFLQSIWINSMAVAGGVFQVTPGGIGTYESIMVMALFGIDIPLSLAYHLSIFSHGFKFAFSYIVGIYVMIKSSYQINVKKVIKESRNQS